MTSTLLSLINSKSPTISLSKALMPLPLLRQLCDALSRVDHVTSLDLSHNQLGDAGVEILCESLLKDKPQLRILNLKSNGITDVGVAFLVRALSRFGTLKTLILGSNPISDVGLSEIGKMVSPAISNENNNTTTATNSPTSPINNNNNNSNNASAAAIAASKAKGLAFVGNVELDEIDLMDTPISLHGTLSFADALVKNESLLHVRLPHVLGHRVLQEVERLTQRNWMRRNRIDEKRAARAADKFQDQLHDAKIAHKWSSVQPRARPPPPATGFTIEEWADAELVPSLIYLEILDKKTKMMKKEQEQEMKRKNRRIVVATAANLSLSGGGGGGGGGNHTSVVKLPSISNRRAW